jgi:hypothetical protein
MPETLEKTELPAANPVTDTLRAKLDHGGTIARFPDGTEALVLPMSCLDELVIAMQRPDFKQTLATSLADFEKGDLELLED